MDFERQKQVTDEYRDNWERVFAESAKQRFMEERINEAVHELTRLIREDMDVFYANGCPILEDECHENEDKTGRLGVEGKLLGSSRRTS
jgi:endo-alpha-1,4-polygalactosaminidase (GH114 family)